jgi:hypothetical protein
MEIPTSASTATYSALHNLPEDHPGEEIPQADTPAELPAPVDVPEPIDDDDDDVDHANHGKHIHSHKEIFESFDFIDSESMMWRKVSFLFSRFPSQN